MLPKITTILLDVDGTLVDSNDAHAHAWVDAFTEFGVEASFAGVRPLIGMGSDRVLPIVDPDIDATCGLGKRVTERRAAIFKTAYLHRLRPMPGSRDLLLALRGHGVQCVVATSATARELEDLLEVARAGDLIDARATADDARESKPAPEIVLAALRIARARAVNAAMLGDTTYDILAAHAAGLPAISLRCGGASEMDLSESAAIFDDPRAFAEALETKSVRDIISPVVLAR